MIIKKLSDLRPGWMTGQHGHGEIGTLLLTESAARRLSIDPVSGGCQVKVPSADRMSRKASVFIPADKFSEVVIIAVGFNARQSATIEGDCIAWSYSDGHGMVLGAVVKLPPEGEKHEFDAWIPGHHGHGPGNSVKYKIDSQAAVESILLPSAPRLSL